MSVVAPLWLLGLVPWTALAVWMLSGRHERAEVPFLQLWRGQAPLPRPRRAIRIPPASILLLLLAALLGVLAAARPVLTILPYTTGPTITIIVDRGLSMSARGQAGPRYIETAHVARKPLHHRFGDGPTNLTLVPDGATIASDRLAWVQALSSREPAPPVDTRQSLPDAIRHALQVSAGPVVVITDQPMPVVDERLMRIPPAGQVRNVGIERVSALAEPTPQVMIRVQNDSALSSASLCVGGATRTIELPPAGQARNYFVDLPPTDDPVEIVLSAEDDQPADNRAKLSRRVLRSEIELRGDVGWAVGPIVDAYRKTRPARAGAAAIVISDKPIPPDQSGVTLMTTGVSRPGSGIEPAPHPINEHVQWSDLRTLSLAGAPGQGWEPILRIGGVPAVAVRQSPARQVWVGFWSEELTRQSQFVIFWANVLDWVAGQGTVYEAAFTPAVPSPPAVADDWRAQLDHIPARFRAGFPLLGPIIFAGLLSVALAALLWGTCKNCASG